MQRGGTRVTLLVQRGGGRVTLLVQRGGGSGGHCACRGNFSNDDASAIALVRGEGVRSGADGNIGLDRWRASMPARGEVAEPAAGGLQARPPARPAAQPSGRPPGRPAARPVARPVPTHPLSGAGACVKYNWSCVKYIFCTGAYN